MGTQVPVGQEHFDELGRRVEPHSASEHLPQQELGLIEPAGGHDRQVAGLCGRHLWIQLPFPAASQNHGICIGIDRSSPQWLQWAGEPDNLAVFLDSFV